MDILRLFFDCDEFCREFDPYLSTKQLTDGKRHRQRGSTLTLSEVMTIVILFQLSGFRNLKTYYTQYVSVHLRSEFPHLVSYQRVELQSMTALPLTAFLHTRFGRCTGISFIDSTPIKVCHNLRIKSNKVFRMPAANVRDKVKKAHSLSPTNGTLRRIGAIAVGMTSDDKTPVPKFLGDSPSY